LTACVNAAIG